MAASPTPIYHITHVGNLPGIIGAGGLQCNGTLKGAGTDYANIAHDTVQDRRQYTMVPCGPGGVLHDYVPFYFAPRSPMLYTISRGNVPTCPQGQGPIVHLVSTAQAVEAQGLGFALTNGHGIVVLTDFYDDLQQLDEVDWKVMPLKYWHDTAEEPDRKRRRQAEFLVHRLFPWDLVTEIGVWTAAVQAQVQAALAATPHKPPVTIRPGWYY